MADPVLSQALAAYARNAAPAGPGMAARDGAAQGGFSQLLDKALGDLETSQKTAGQATLQAVAGKADLTEVVTAVTNAEVTLQTVVAVRDKVIQAYQDIMRMPI